jgi:hypothetical protein
LPLAPTGTAFEWPFCVVVRFAAAVLFVAREVVFLTLTGFLAAARLVVGAVVVFFFAPVAVACVGFAARAGIAFEVVFRGDTASTFLPERRTDT